MKRKTTPEETLRRLIQKRVLDRRVEFGEFARDDAAMKRFVALLLACHDEAMFELAGYGYQLESFLDEPDQCTRDADNLARVDASLDAPTDVERLGSGRREAKLLNLTASELTRVIDIARGAGKRHENEKIVPHVALFLADILARFKWARAQGFAGAPIAKIVGETAAGFASPVPGEFDFGSLVELSGVIREHTPVENVGGTWHVATYVVDFEFDSDSPKQPLHIKTGLPTEFERRWLSLQEAAAGRDGRKIPKPQVRSTSAPPRRRS